MNELIKGTYDNDRPVVLVRELHEFLEVKTAYKDWFPRMCEYGFTEGQDFCSFLSESTGGRPAQDAALTINKTPKVTGKGQVYFINRFLAEAAHPQPDATEM